MTGETAPWKGARDFSYHWLHAERSSAPSIAQWCRGRWALIGEAETITPAELASRGWEYLGPVGGRPFSGYLDR